MDPRSSWSLAGRGDAVSIAITGGADPGQALSLADSWSHQIRGVIGEAGPRNELANLAVNASKKGKAKKKAKKAKKKAKKIDAPQRQNSSAKGNSPRHSQLASSGIEGIEQALSGIQQTLKNDSKISLSGIEGIEQALSGIEQTVKALAH